MRIILGLIALMVTCAGVGVALDGAIASVTVDTVWKQISNRIYIVCGACVAGAGLITLAIACLMGSVNNLREEMAAAREKKESDETGDES